MPGSRNHGYDNSESGNEKISSDIFVPSTPNRQRPTKYPSDGGYSYPVMSPSPSPSRQPGRTLNETGSRNHGYDNSESSNEKRSSDISVPSTPNRHRPTKYPSDGGYSYSMTSPSPSRQPGRTLDETHRRVPSIPKFGDWDEADPKSAEGYTVIFERIKEEKIGVASVPATPDDQITSQYEKRNHGQASWKSKVSCCLLPATDD